MSEFAISVPIPDEHRSYGILYRRQQAINRVVKLKLPYWQSKFDWRVWESEVEKRWCLRSNAVIPACMYGGRTYACQEVINKEIETPYWYAFRPIMMRGSKDYMHEFKFRSRGSRSYYQYLFAVIGRYIEKTKPTILSLEDRDKFEYDVRKRLKLRGHNWWSTAKIWPTTYHGRPGDNWHFITINGVVHEGVTDEKLREIRRLYRHNELGVEAVEKIVARDEPVPAAIEIESNADSERVVLTRKQRAFAALAAIEELGIKF